MLSTLSNSTIGRFRIVAFAEGCSFLLFALTMPLKYMYGMRGPNFVVGSIHGFLFILYVVLLYQVMKQYKWPLIKAFWAFIASLVPFGTFYADKKLFRDTMIDD